MIISALLNTLITANNLSFKICEIEEDAIFFYQLGPAYPAKVILEQFEAMLFAFNTAIQALNTDYPQVSQLSIKSVVHYGVIGELSVNGFHKLYGQTVVEAHRLLKNHIDSHTYALITEEYIGEQVNQWAGGSQQCEIYDVGKLCYTYFDYHMIFN